MKKKIFKFFLFVCVIMIAVNAFTAEAFTDYSIYGYVSYWELEDAFVNPDYYGYQKIKEDDKNGKFKAEAQYFMPFFEKISSGNMKLPLPYYKGEQSALHDADGKQIAMFSNREFGLPWIWYYSDFEDFPTIFKITFPEMLGKEKTQGLETYSDYCEKFEPSLPTLKTPKAQYQDKYKSITEEEITFANGKTVTALVYTETKEMAGFNRKHYNFVYEGLICSVMNVYSDGFDKFTPQLWKEIELKGVIASEEAAKEAAKNAELQGETVSSDVSGTSSDNISDSAGISKKIIIITVSSLVGVLVLGIIVLIILRRIKGEKNG